MDNKNISSSLAEDFQYCGEIQEQKNWAKTKAELILFYVPLVNHLPSNMSYLLKLKLFLIDPDISYIYMKYETFFLSVFSFVNFQTPSLFVLEKPVIWADELKHVFLFLEKQTYLLWYE